MCVCVGGVGGCWSSRSHRHIQTCDSDNMIERQRLLPANPYQQRKYDNKHTLSDETETQYGLFITIGAVT